MKAQKLLYLTIFSILSFEVLSPVHVKPLNPIIKFRAPASAENIAQPVNECVAELSGEQLQTDVHQLIKDKESILEEIKNLKKEKEAMKKPQNENTIAMMSEITSLLTSQMQQQMQLQMQMQMQMMNLMQQMQSLSMPSTNSFAQQSPTFTMNDYLNFVTPFIGQPAKNNSPWSSYVNPYIMLPEMTRSEIPQHDFGFLPKTGPARGFNFSQPDIMPEMHKQEIPASFPESIFT